MKFQHTFEIVTGVPLIVKSLLTEVLPRGMGKTVAIDQLQKTKKPFKLRKVIRYNDTSERINFLLIELLKYSDMLEYENLSLLQRVVYRNHYNKLIDEYHALTVERNKLAVQLKLNSCSDNVPITTHELRNRCASLNVGQVYAK